MFLKNFVHKKVDCSNLVIFSILDGMEVSDLDEFGKDPKNPCPEGKDHANCLLFGPKIIGGKGAPGAPPLPAGPALPAGPVPAALPVGPSARK